jgi:hypothetical protein
MNENLTNALEIIFQDSTKIGFWDSKNSYIAEKIINDMNWQWRRSKSNSHRYGLFTLSMILLSKDIFNLDTTKYDGKILDFINWTYKNLKKFSIDELTYGGLLSVILGKKLYNLENFDFNFFEDSLTTTYNKLFPLNDNQHSLILIPIKYLLDLKQTEKQLHQLKNLTSLLISSKKKSLFFETGDIKANYHQRIMYVLWGLIFASNYCYRNEIKKIFEDTINYVWEKRKDRDNAFLWHPSFYIIKNKYKIKIPVFNPKSTKYLFECHQTFFANSINFYQKFFSSNLYQQEKVKALEWIWGSNRIKKNLNEITGIGIPARIMNTSGELLIKRQQFIGSYEIGSLILALAAQNCE